MSLDKIKGCGRYSLAIELEAGDAVISLINEGLESAGTHKISCWLFSTLKYETRLIFGSESPEPRDKHV